MLPYVLIAVTSTVLAALSATVTSQFSRKRAEIEPRKSARTLWNPFDALLVAILVTFSAIRYNVGTDFRLYTSIYAGLNPRLDWFEQVRRVPQEASYTLLSLLVKNWTDSPYGILWAAAFITVVPIYAVIKRQSANITMSVALYVLLASYLVPFNIVRQGIAISILFFAYSLLPRRRVAFALLAALSVTFHASAAIAIVLLLVARIWRARTRTIVTVLVIATVGAVSLLTLPIVGGLLGVLNFRYAEYLESGEQSGVGTYLIAASYLALLVVVIRYRTPSTRSDWIAALAIAIALMALGTQLSVAGRLSNYFSLFAILLIPQVVHSAPRSRITALAVIVGACVYFVMYLQAFGDLVPYQTYVG